jgi:hypothetical protein
LIYILPTLLWLWQASADRMIEPRQCFYTPMSQIVLTGRDYVLTSNAHQWLDMGSGLQSYETLAFLEFSNSDLPDTPVERAWLRLASGAGGSMGETTRELFVTIHPTQEDVEDILDGAISPHDFYVYNDYVLRAVDGIYVFNDGVCYWDITEAVNSWIAYNQSSGAEGIQNNGLAITGRNDYGANDPDDNEHTGFWSLEATQGSNPMSHAAAPVILFTQTQNSFDKPWLPYWRQESGYTSQFWTLSAANGKVFAPLSPDGYSDNAFGEPNLVWQEETQIGDDQIINPFLSWHPCPDNEDSANLPEWVDGVYGGVYRGNEYASHTMKASIPTGSEPGVMKVFVQYDWYGGGNVDVNIANSTEVTPGQITNCEIFKQAAGWYRTVKVFELTGNPGQLQVNFTVSGYEPYIDSLSITTALNVQLPPRPLRDQRDINLDGIISQFEFADLAQKWRQGIASTDELLYLADIWLEESYYQIIY